MKREKIKVNLDFHDTYCEIEFEDKVRSVFMGRSHNFDSEESMRFEAVMKSLLILLKADKI